MFYPPATRTFEDIVGLKRKRQDTEYFDSYDISDVLKYEHPVRNGHSARSSGSSRCSISSGASSDTLDIKATYDGLLLRLPELVSHRYSRTLHDQLHSARCHTPPSAGQIADQAILHDLVGFACQGAVLVMQTDLPVTSALGSDTRRHSPLSTARQYPSYSTFHSLPKHPVQRYPQALEIAHNDFDHSCLHYETTFQRYSDHQRSPMAPKRYDGLPPYSQMHQPISERRNDSAAASLEGLLNGSRGFETDHPILGRFLSNTPHHLPQVLPPSNRFERRTMGSNVGPPSAKAAVRCLNCDKRETPEWRKGPYGPRTLCNACGLVWAKIQKKRAKDASITAKTNGATAIHHTALHPLARNQPSQV